MIRTNPNQQQLIIEEGNQMDLWDKVCEQIERDVNDPLNDLQALYLMLQRVPKDVLIAYLPEEETV